MHSKTYLSAIVLLTGAIALSTAEIAVAADGHSHGKASFDVALDAKTIRIVGDIPLEALVGFERVPKSDADTAKIKAAALLLRSADKLFTFSEEANCKSKQTELSSTAINATLLGGSASPAVASAPADSHIDIDAVWIFQCEKPEALKSMAVHLFDDFKGLKVIQVKVVGGKRQVGGRLTASSRKVTW